MKQMHATVLNQMGFDPSKVTYIYSGLDQTLVGVEGAEPIKGVGVNCEERDLNAPSC